MVKSFLMNEIPEDHPLDGSTHSTFRELGGNTPLPTGKECQSTV